MKTERTSPDWIAAAADAAIAHAEARKGPGCTVVCASGISPSGPVHLGNLREVLTAHAIAEELRARGRSVVHLHSWDDFDRLRKVPVGVPESWAQFVGFPLSRVPDPEDRYPSWAEKYRAEFLEAVEPLGLDVRWISQSEQYALGTYADAIHTSMVRRGEIFDILARYQTESRQTASADERRAAFWPYKIYDPVTGKDDAQIVAYDEATRVIRYRSVGDGKERETCLAEENLGKLSWKVDWPMRWAHEQVDFEPGGTDHSSPGSSYTVGTELVPAIFGWRAPSYVAYAFVGFAGRVKMSSSSGQAITPAFALRSIEPALLRWLYLRRRPDAEFQIDFGPQLWRAYDEWDMTARKAAAGTAGAVEAAMVGRAERTSVGPIARPEQRVSFRTLWTAIDMTQGNREEALRVAAESVDDSAIALADLAAFERRIEPRLSCARGWVESCLDPQDRLQPRRVFDHDSWDGLDATQHADVVAFARALAEVSWSYAAIEGEMYAVARRRLGLAPDAAPTPELKAGQRGLFVALYRLLLGQDEGPRLPTLLLALGRERVLALLGGAGV